MTDWLPLAALDKVGTIGIVLFIAGLVITDRLVWHTRLKLAEARADRWEKVALDALQTGARSGVRAAEVSHEVLSRLPTIADGPQEVETG